MITRGFSKTQNQKTEVFTGNENEKLLTSPMKHTYKAEKPFYQK
jgi:hypothetical protein